MTDFDLSGRRCLITAGSRTLGAAIAREFARRGAAVAVNFHRSEAEAYALCHEIQSAGGTAIALQADVADERQAVRLLDASWEALDGLDTLVNNYGPWTAAPFTALSFDEYDRVMAGNVRAPFVLCRDAGLRMRKSAPAGQTGRGVIINIAATDAFERGRSVYGLAKAALVHLTEALAVELAPDVRVLSVAPGLIADNEGMTPSVVEAELAHTPLRRLVTRAEVAEVVCLLCEPAFASVTGQTIRMDGGARIPRTSPPG